MNTFPGPSRLSLLSLLSHGMPRLSRLSDKLWPNQSLTPPATYDKHLGPRLSSVFPFFGPLFFCFLTRELFFLLSTVDI